jgi:hypothetical protein
MSKVLVYLQEKIKWMERLKILKGQLETVNRRTDNTMAKKKKDKRTNNNLLDCHFGFL